MTLEIHICNAPILPRLCFFAIQLHYADDRDQLLCQQCVAKIVEFRQFADLCIASHAKFHDQWLIEQKHVDKSNSPTTWFESTYEDNENEQKNNEKQQGVPKHSSMSSSAEKQIMYNCSDVSPSDEHFRDDVKYSLEIIKCEYADSLGQQEEVRSDNTSTSNDKSADDRNFTVHTTKSHVSDDKVGSVTSTLRFCTSCPNTFETLSGLRKHMLKIHQTKILVKSFKCQTCSEDFQTKATLIAHITEAHSEHRTRSVLNSEHENTDARWKCGACGKTFKTRRTMHQHRSLTGHKTPRRPLLNGRAKRETGLFGDYHCDICKKSYSTKRKIRHHMETHDTKKKKQKFLCTVCGIWLSSNNILESHYRAIHLGEKRFQCNYCDRLFSFRQDLKVHINRHEGIRPYSCKLCPKSFYLSSNLKEHMESIHLNAKRHVCSICNKAFNRKGNLKLHTFTHTRQAPHQCATCGAGFSRKYKFLEHTQNCTNKNNTNVQVPH